VLWPSLHDSTYWFISPQDHETVLVRITIAYKIKTFQHELFRFFKIKRIYYVKLHVHVDKRLNGAIDQYSNFDLSLKIAL